MYGPYRKPAVLKRRSCVLINPLCLRSFDNVGLLFGPLNTSCRTVLRTQKRTIILTTTEMRAFTQSHPSCSLGDCRQVAASQHGVHTHWLLSPAKNLKGRSSRMTGRSAVAPELTRTLLVAGSHTAVSITINWAGSFCRCPYNKRPDGLTVWGLY